MQHIKLIFSCSAIIFIHTLTMEKAVSISQIFNDKQSRDTRRFKGKRKPKESLNSSTLKGTLICGMEGRLR